MKKIFALSILTALLLTGCGQAAPETIPTTQAVTETAAAVPDRPAQIEMEFMLEGMSEKQPATLYVGEGYSLYIPDGDYEMTEESHWTFAANDQLAFEVVFYPGVTEDDLRTAITPAPLTQGEDGRWFMAKRDGSSWDSPCLDVWLYPAEDGVYALYSHFFLEAAEGFGVRIAAVAASFEITK